MAAWRYEISLLVFKNILLGFCALTREIKEISYFQAAMLLSALFIFNIISISTAS